MPTRTPSLILRRTGRLSLLLFCCWAAACGQDTAAEQGSSDTSTIDVAADQSAADVAQLDAPTVDAAVDIAADTYVDPCPTGAVCDDGDPCTLGDRCKDHVCEAGGVSLCECKTDGDCAGKDDGDACNGTLFCEKGTLPWECKVNLGTVVTCDDTELGCTQAVCKPKTGLCAYDPVPDGALCDDDNPCTVPGACKAGKCALGPNTCTCASDADCAPKEDGDLCNGTLFCKLADGTCEVNPATVNDCPTVDDTACAKNTCAPKTGTCAPEPVPNNTACDDGDKCTEGDACTTGKCIAGTNTCLCTTDADCEDKNGDGDFCNGTMFCNKVNGLCQLNPTTVISCPSVADTACQQNGCLNVFEDKGGVKLAVAASCVMIAVVDTLHKACEDDNSCTTGDTCVGGACKAGTNTCLCKSDAECEGKYGDGDLCNGTLFCNKQVGECELNPSTVVQSCPTTDNTQCTFRECEKKSGKCALQFKTDGDPCADDDTCTANDFCKDGKCATGLTYTCACDTDNDCAAKDDGDVCNGILYCDKTGKSPECKHNPQSVIVCPTASDTACLKNACDPKNGACYLAPTATQTTCDDDLHGRRCLRWQRQLQARRRCLRVSGRG